MEPSHDSDYMNDDRELMVLRVAQRKGSKLVAVAAAAGLVLTPTIATGMPAKKRAPAVVKVNDVTVPGRASLAPPSRLRTLVEVAPEVTIVLRLDSHGPERI